MKNKIRQSLQRKIQQKRKNKPITDESQDSFSDQVHDYISNWTQKFEIQQHKPQSKGLYQIDDTEEEKEIEKTRNKIHEQEKELDELKYEMIGITKQTQSVNMMKNETKKRQHQKLEEMLSCHKKELESISNNFEEKIDKYLNQIENLLQQKAEFNKECQVFINQGNKMNKIVKDFEERYRKEIKNVKEAQLVLQKERITKWEQEKIKGIKEQAVLSLNPKLQAIIHQNKEEIKSKTSEWTQKTQDFKINYTKEKNQELQQMKKDIFEKGQKEKEALRVEERKKLKENHEKLQLQFEEDRKKLRQMYKDQIMELQKKRLEEIDQFLTENKSSHEEQLAQIKKLKENYQQKIRKMEKNIKESIEEEVEKVEKKYKKRNEQQIKELLQENEKKLQNATKAIEEEFMKKNNKIKLQIQKQKSQFETDIYHKYEEKMNTYSAENEEERKKLKKKIADLQELLILEERSKQTEDGKISQFQKQSYQTQRKVSQLQMEINDKKNTILHLQSEMQRKKQEIKKEVNQIENKKKEMCLHLDEKIGMKKKEKEEKEKEWVAKFTNDNEYYSNELSALKETMNQAIEKEFKVCENLKKEITLIEEDNERIQSDLQKQIKQIKM